MGGAYRATPVRQLESELFIPPLDLYLNKRLADFEGRIATTGKDQLLRRAREKAAASLGRQHHGRRPAGGTAYALCTRRTIESGQAKAEWTTAWRHGEEETDARMIEDWQARWDRLEGVARAKGTLRVPADQASLSQRALAKYHGLRKHEASLLLQLRTGKVGLRAFLFDRKVPDVITPLCSCGTEKETPAHIALNCVLYGDEREELRRALAPRALRSHRDFEAITDDPTCTATVVRWFLATGRFEQFTLATQIGGYTEKAPKERRERGATAPNSKIVSIERAQVVMAVLTGTVERH